MNHLAYPQLCPCGVVHKPPLAELLEGTHRPYHDMASAVVQLQTYTGAGPTAINAEVSGFKYNREDTPYGTTPIPIPTGAGTNYSWLKWLALAVVSTGTTSMSNRRIQLSAAESAGLGIFFTGAGTYAQAAGGNMPASAAGNGPATPAGITQRASSGSGGTPYDSATTLPTSVTGRNGLYCETVLGVDSSAPGAGNNVALPDIRLIYDEA